MGEANLGESEVDLACRRVCLGVCESGLGFFHRCLILVELLHGNGSQCRGADGSIPIVNGLRQLEGRLIEGDLTQGLIELGLVGARVDFEQQRRPS